MTLAQCLAVEESDDVEERIRALQQLINGGTAWKFQGSYGRAMMDAINAGQCALGHTGTRDAYGNYIPSRTEVQPGTKGSVAYVERCGFEVYE